jgi:uncharacterized membrane protein
MLWIGVRQQRRRTIAFALLLQLLAGFGYLLEAGGRGTGMAVLNALCLSSALVSAAGLFSSYYLYRHFNGARRWEAACAKPMLIWGLLWWFGNGWHEIEAFVPGHYRLTAVILLGALSSAILGLLERRLDWKTLRHTPAGLLAALILLAVTALIVKPHFFADYGYLAWSAAAVVYYGLLYQRDQLSGVTVSMLNLLHAMGLWLITGVLGYEAQWGMEQWLPAGSWDDAVIGLTLAFALFIAARLPCWPFTAHRDAYIGLAGATLAGFLALWTLCVNLGTSGDPWPFPYLPLLNALDIAQLLVFAAALSWWRHPHAQQSWHQRNILFYSLLGAATFLWLNAVLMRSLHYWFDLPLDADAIFDSTLAQACLSVFWTLIGLGAMLLASWRGLRQVWIAAAALLGVTVAKLFLHDLADSETLESILSFIVVGILLLLVGYYSPLPPRIRN